MPSIHVQAGGNLLVIHPGALGDVLLSVPAIRALRQACPFVQVGLLANDKIAELLVACGEVHQSFSWNRSGLACLLSGQFDRVSPLLQGFLNNSSAVVGWMKDEDGSLKSTFISMGIHDCVFVSPHSLENRMTHQSIKFLQAAGLEDGPSGMTWKLSLSLALQKQGEEILHTKLPQRVGPLVCLHPGSGSPHKCFQPSFFAKLVEDLQKQGACPILLQGPIDAKQVGAVEDACRNPPPVIRDVSVADLAGLLSRMDLFIGHDSGVTHLAAALSVQTIALFGPTDPQQWAPLGANVAVLSGPACYCQDWNQIRACQEKPCLMISPSHVMEVCRSLLPSSPMGHSLKEDNDLSCSV